MQETLQKIMNAYLVGFFDRDEMLDKVIMRLEKWPDHFDGPAATELANILRLLQR